jgi:hypothetical protein
VAQPLLGTPRGKPVPRLADDPGLVPPLELPMFPVALVDRLRGIADAVLAEARLCVQGSEYDHGLVVIFPYLHEECLWYLLQLLLLLSRERP